MITCPNCAKENQDHYKFCLGCGARLPAGGGPPAGAPAGGPPQPNPYGQQQPPPGPAQPPHGQAPQGVPQPGAPQQPPAAQQPGPGFAQHPGAPQQAPQAGPPQAGPPQAGPPPDQSMPQPAAQAAAANMVACSKCGTDNPKGFAFCGRCGNKLNAAPPTPSAQAAPAGTPAARGPDMGSARTMFVDPSDSQGQEMVQQMQQQAAAIGAPPAPGPNTNVGPAPSGPQVPTPQQPPAGAPQPQQPQPQQPQPQQPDADGAALASARLVLLREDGSEGGSLAIQGGPQMLGRDFGPPFDQDAYLDPQHADLTITTDGIKIDDRSSVNGVYYRLIGKTELQSGDQFRVGQELIRYEDLPEPEPTSAGTERMGSPNPGFWGRLCIMVEPEVIGAAHPIHEEAMTIGREEGDVTFPEDGYVSGTHCRVFGDDTGVFLEDLNSSNGTYMRVRSGQTVPFGSLILVGQQLFRADAG